MGARVESRDHGAKAIVKALTSAEGAVLRVGVLEGDEAHGATTVGEVAAYQEFGTETIPARSFIRGWYDETFDANRALFRAMMRAVTRGEMTTEQVFGQLGSLFVGQIQKRIADEIPPPLDPKTIAAKGSSVPLIDTGQLRSSITFEVE